MKAWIVALLLLALPTAAAEPAPTRQRDTVVQTAPGTHVTEQLEWTIATEAEYDGMVRFYASSAASNVRVSLVQGATTRPIAEVLKGSSGVEGLDLYRADLKPTQATVPAGGAYTVLVDYDLTGSVAPLRTFYAVPSMTLFVKPLGGQTPRSEYFTEFVPAGHDAYHSARTDVPKDTTYTVSFSAVAAPAASSDMTKWMWLALGLLVGIVLMVAAAKAGWVGGPQGKKFSKGGDMESRTMLEARRRTLLAALKELEAAHEAKEIPDDAYAPLKEEYKAQAVRVMRSLEDKREA